MYPILNLFSRITLKSIEVNVYLVDNVTMKNMFLLNANNKEFHIGDTPNISNCKEYYVINRDQIIYIEFIEKSQIMKCNISENTNSII